MKHGKQWAWAMAVAAGLVLAGGSAQTLHAEEKPEKSGGSALEHEMKAINQAYKALRRQVKDAAKNESSLKLLAEMEQHTLAAKLLTPAKAAAVSESERSRFIADYRKMIDKLLRQELDVEEQILDGQNGKAAEAFDALHDIQSKGHKEFRKHRRH